MQALLPGSPAGLLEHSQRAASFSKFVINLLGEFGKQCPSLSLGSWFEWPAALPRQYLGCCINLYFPLSPTLAIHKRSLLKASLPSYPLCSAFMAGHNKWSKIKRSKGVLDSRRGKLFSRLSREITVAAKSGGADPDSNARLRSAILAAKTENMPGDTIERALKKGTGELQGEAYEEIVYEGYAPGGVAIIVETATDNRNRTAADLRLAFSKNHGSFASSGSVSYMFHRKGRISIEKDSISEDELFELVLDLGAEELVAEDLHHTILTPVSSLYSVQEALLAKNLPLSEVQLTYIPETTVQVSDEATAQQVLRLCEALEDVDDVQNVHSNFEIPEELMSQLA